MATIFVEGRKIVKQAISVATGASVDLADLSGGDSIVFAQVEVTTAFDGVATLKVGITGTLDLVLDLTESDLEDLDRYTAAAIHELAADTTLKMTFDAGASTLGAAQLIVIIERE